MTGGRAEYDARYRAANAEQRHECHRRWRDRLRAAVLDHYGRQCACCGAAAGLVIDHLDGHGREHRAELFGRQQAGAEFWLWLVRNGFPDGYQTLCRPCNSSKRNEPACRLDHREAVAA